MSDKSSASTGVSGTTLLLILFIGLKLTGYIDWSWWWVMSPMWIPMVIGLLLLPVLMVLGLLSKSKRY